MPCTGVMQGFSQKLLSGTPQQHVFRCLPCAARGSRELLECSSAPITRHTIGRIHSFIYLKGFGRLSYQNNEQKVAALRQPALPALDLPPHPPSPPVASPVVVAQDPGSIPGSLLYELISAVSLSQALTITHVELSASCDVADRPAGLGMFRSLLEPAVPRLGNARGG